MKLANTRVVFCDSYRPSLQFSSRHFCQVDVRIEAMISQTDLTSAPLEACQNQRKHRWKRAEAGTFGEGLAAAAVPIIALRYT